METRKMKLALSAGALALSLALAGCGGGSSSSAPQPASGGGGAADDEQQTPSPEQLASTASGLLDTAKAAVDAVMDDSDDATVMIADTAVTNAANAVKAASEADNHAMLTQRLGTLQGSLTEKKTSRTAAMSAAAGEKRKTMTAEAKALKAAIMAGMAAGDVAVTTGSIPGFDPDGNSGSITTETAAITLKKGDATGMLGSWSGTDYTGMVGTGDAKTTGMVRAYSNAEAAKSHGFATEAGEDVHGLSHATSTDVKGDYAIGEGDDGMKVGGFPTTGQHDYDPKDEVAGSYMGASGTYTCTAAAGSMCMATAAGEDGTTLSTGWTFMPSSGAMVEQKDANYLQFGWWVRKDKDGPTHAGAFYRPNVTALAAVTAIDNDTLIGPATYMGAATGKFAISNPLDAGNDNAGHFTADVELTADFKETGSTLTGTIDAFQLNDGSDDPGWNVELQKTTWSSTNSNFATATTPSGDQTVWSIGGAKGGASGSWAAQMYNDKASDSTNIPHSVAGSFSSSIGTTHSMVGAFGAEKQ